MIKIRDDRYNAIKRLCGCELGVPSQVVKANTLSDPKKHSKVCKKIAIQMNCKLGGQPWAIRIPFNSCMIIGINVYNDPTQRGKSVVGIVSSTNPMVTTWYSRTYFQNTNEELVNTLGTGFVSCLMKFNDNNNCLPQRIFIYRDGVSDGQVLNVKEYELSQIHNAIEDLQKQFDDYFPKISFIVVQNANNTKLMMISGQGLDNPPPGSVLDHSITRKDFQDFYLISQFVNQGTVVPTHYIILYDSNDMPTDRMQKLTYKLSHLYYQIEVTVHIPAPCLILPSNMRVEIVDKEYVLENERNDGNELSIHLYQGLDNFVVKLGSNTSITKRIKILTDIH